MHGLVFMLLNDPYAPVWTDVSIARHTKCSVLLPQAVAPTSTYLRRLKNGNDKTQYLCTVTSVRDV